MLLATNNSVTYWKNAYIDVVFCLCIYLVDMDIFMSMHVTTVCYLLHICCMIMVGLISVRMFD